MDDAYALEEADLIEGFEQHNSTQRRLMWNMRGSAKSPTVLPRLSSHQVGFLSA